MNLDLSGKSALVCGSTQGIGLAAAQELARMGASVTLLARNEEKLVAAVGSLNKDLGGQNHAYLVADFNHPDKLKSIIENHLKAGLQYNILINNTGGPTGGPAIDAGLDEFRIAFNQHLVCNQVMAQALVGGMKNLGYGRIINVISTSVKIPLNGLGVSNTIRGAVANWAKTLANELGQFNITVNNVLPGATNTVRLSSIIENKAKKTGNTEDSILEGMKNQVPMKRVAEPEEVANAIAFLASPSASYINGINVPVDGGRTGSL
ncbi:MAG: SDR family oxidoreductase [Salibacteraceae bacterium]|nr:SDR family oxidoreductase [Salibacteraceae bacterium]|tara:strand:+ start:4446 stop:5237 length:792 start_codon:yes stop_codon:yes gene_type:complete